MDNWPVDPVYCGWFGCYQDIIHERFIWLAKACGVASFALALVLYLVFRQRKLLMMPLVLGAFCLLLALWGQVGDAVLLAVTRTHPNLSEMLPDQQQAYDLFGAFTFLALGATGLLLLAGGMKVLVEWPGALYQHREKQRTASRQRRP
jgi:hypothetical protein